MAIASLGRRRLLTGLAAGGAAVLLGNAGPRAQTAARSLPIDARVPLISVADLAAILRYGGAHGRPVIVDVREEDEFQVSHLAGAFRVAPEARAAAAVAQIRSRAAGRDLVLYCTTRMRSLRLAEAVYHDLIDAGIQSLHVLDGGIIGWANAGRPLVDRIGDTRAVHPGDREMAQLLADQARVRYTPRI